MAAESNLYGPGKQRAFSPYLDAGERKELHDLLQVEAPLPASFADELRSLARRYVDDGDSVKLRAICLLVADLCEQGWRINVEAGRISFGPPGIGRDGQQSVEDVKTRVRQALQAARGRQLQEPSVRQFLMRMERRTLRPAGRFSVLDLIDDGAALARELAKVGELAADERERALAGLVDPVIEICEAGAKCPDTGLGLIDVRRYFRHTWAHEYRSMPGRQMLVLVRNAARPRRPVMGIAMLASPVMRLACRDTWIGWLRESARDRLDTGLWEPAAFSSAVLDRVDSSIANIRWDDLATQTEIASPTETVALRLEQRAAGAIASRDLELRAHFDEHRQADGRVRPHRGDVKSAAADTDWRAASEDLLFVRKRAESLAQLLYAKQTFEAAGLAQNPSQALDALFGSRAGEKALDIALTEFRKAGLSSEVADVSICGAVHPYNQLLAGKLVTVLLTSREVRDAHARRYGGQVSVIASQMVGRAITKPARLTGTACRWLLADEVGLGKTIQAIMVMRALAAQSPRPLTAALVVPDDLVSQWEEELLCRGHVLALESGDEGGVHGNLVMRLVRPSRLLAGGRIVADRSRPYAAPLAPIADYPWNWYVMRERAVDLMIKLAREDFLDVRNGQDGDQRFKTMWYKVKPNGGDLTIAEIDTRNSWFRQAFISHRAAIECPPRTNVVQNDDAKRRLNFFDHGCGIHDGAIAAFEKQAPAADITTEFVVEYPEGHPILRWANRRLLVAVSEVDLRYALVFDPDAILGVQETEASKAEQDACAAMARIALAQFQADRRWMIDFAAPEMLFATLVEDDEELVVTDAGAAVFDPFHEGSGPRQLTRRRSILSETRLRAARSAATRQLTAMGGAPLGPCCPSGAPRSAAPALRGAGRCRQPRRGCRCRDQGRRGA